MATTTHLRGPGDGGGVGSGTVVGGGSRWRRVPWRRLIARNERVGHVHGPFTVRPVVDRSHHDHHVQRFTRHVVDGSLFFQRTDFVAHADQSAAAPTTRPARQNDEKN